MVVKIAVVAGTRPETIKLIPVYEALAKSDHFVPTFIATGQHKEMVDGVFEAFNFHPDRTLDVLAKGQSLTSLMSRLLIGLEKQFIAEKIDLVVVQGDTSSALAGAISAHYAKIPVAHVEAGLRTMDKWSPFPEETHRRMIAGVADFHFAATQQSAQALQKENINSGVYVVGNTVVDALLEMRSRISQQLSNYQNMTRELQLLEKKYIVVTAHRRENFGDGIENICAALIQLAEINKDIEIIVTVHLNPMVKDLVRERLGGLDRIRLIEPLPYDQMVFLLMRAWLILTDSGGLQEEAPSLNVPILVMREKTERPEGVIAGCSKLVGVDRHTIVTSVNNLLNDETSYRAMADVANPYGDGCASQRIVSILEREM